MIKKKSLLISIVFLILISSATLVYAENVVLRPYAEFMASAWVGEGTCWNFLGDDYICVNEDTADNDTGRIGTNVTANSTFILNQTGVAGTTYDNITVYYNVEAVNAQWDLLPYIMLGNGSEYAAGGIIPIFPAGLPEYYVVEQFWGTVPGGTNSWTDAELNSLVVGIRGQNFVGGAYGKATQIWVNASFGDPDNDNDGFLASEDCNDNNATVRPFLNGSTHTLNSSIIVCAGVYQNTHVVINANDLFIDCNGSAILNGSNSVGNGIYSSGRDNNTVLGCEIVNYYNGVYMTGSDKNNVSNNTIYNLSWTGIYFQNWVFDNVAHNNTVYDSLFGIIARLNSHRHNFTNNHVYNITNIGLHLHSSDNNRLENNIIRDIQQFAIGLQTGSDNNQILNNTIYNVTRAALSSYGIEIKGNSNNNLINGNRISNVSRYAIWIRDTSDNTNISNNTIFNNTGYGLYVNGTSTTIVYNNTIYNTANASIFAGNSLTNLRILSNTIFNGSVALWINDSGNDCCILKDSNFYNNTVGIGVNNTNISEGYFANSTLNNTIDIALNASNVSVVNVTLNRDSIQIINFTTPSHFYFEWYTLRYVNDSAGTPLDNVNVEIKDVTGTSWINLTTGASGFTRVYIATEYYQTNQTLDTRTIYYNYTSVGSKTDYFTNSTSTEINTNRMGIFITLTTSVFTTSSGLLLLELYVVFVISAFACLVIGVIFAKAENNVTILLLAACFFLFVAYYSFAIERVSFKNNAVRIVTAQYIELGAFFGFLAFVTVILVFMFLLRETSERMAGGS